MSPLIFIPITLFGVCGTLTVLFVFCAREARSWKDSPMRPVVQDLRENIESFEPPSCSNEWERPCWAPRNLLDVGAEAEAFLAGTTAD